MLNPSDLLNCVELRNLTEKKPYLCRVKFLSTYDLNFETRVKIALN